MSSHRTIIAGGALLILAAFIFWNSTTLTGLFLETAQFFARNAEKYPGASLAVFTALSALSAMLAPLSSVPLVPFAIAVWGSEITFILLMVGWMIGGGCTYLIGRLVAYPLLRHLVLFEKFDFYREHLSAKSQFWLVFLFRLAMPAEIPGYVLGGLRYEFGKYFLATFVTELPVGLLTVYAGEAFLAENEMMFIALVIFATGAFALFYRSFHQAIRKIKQQER